jgi:hypothetical protein
MCSKYCIARCLEQEEENCQRVFSFMITNYYTYGNKVDALCLDKEAISSLGKRDTKWVKCLFKKNMFTRKSIQLLYVL